MSSARRFAALMVKLARALGVASPRRPHPLAVILGSCPRCSGPFERHRTWRLAAVALSESTGTEQLTLARLVDERRWAEASLIAIWQWDLDIREYEVVDCPVTGSMALAIVVYTFELWARNDLQEVRTLLPEDQVELARLAADQWMSLEKAPEVPPPK